MNQYFQITTDGRNPTAIQSLTDSAARSRADKGPHWFLLRTGADEAHPVGFAAVALSAGQQQRLEAFRAATPGCALPAAWNEAGEFDRAGANVPLKRSQPSPKPASSGAGEYIRAAGGKREGAGRKADDASGARVSIGVSRVAPDVAARIAKAPDRVAFLEALVRAAPDA